MEGKSMFQKIKDGLSLSKFRQDFHKEVMSQKEGMPAKPAMQEKPANVVELSEADVAAANELADSGYEEQEQEENKKVA